MTCSTLLQFCEGWKEMVEKNKPDNGLDQCFYHFFASFVIYNCIYNFFYKTSEKTADNQEAKKRKSNPSKSKKKTNGDHYKAVNFMADYISKNSAIQSLLADNRDSISEATTLLLLNKFYIYDRGDDGKEAAEEISLKNVLKSQNENREKLENVLELLYRVRCNMFHGEKELIPKQKELLEPLNHILDSINETMLGILQAKYERENA